MPNKKNKNPLVSIYITNYNYGNFFSQAIESCLRQTYDNYEVIIIDDGSSDNSIDIIKKYEKKPKIRVILQENKGS